MEQEKQKVTLELSERELFALEQIIKEGLTTLQNQELLNKTEIIFQNVDMLMQFGSKVLLQLVEGKHKKSPKDIKRIADMKEVEKMRLEGNKEIDEEFGGDLQ